MLRCPQEGENQRAGGRGERQCFQPPRRSPWWRRQLGTAPGASLAVFKRCCPVGHPKVWAGLCVFGLSYNSYHCLNPFAVPQAFCVARGGKDTLMCQNFPLAIKGRGRVVEVSGKLDWTPDKARPGRLQLPEVSGLLFLVWVLANDKSTDQWLQKASPGLKLKRPIVGWLDGCFLF